MVDNDTTHSIEATAVALHPKVGVNSLFSRLVACAPKTAAAIGLAAVTVLASCTAGAEHSSLYENIGETFASCNPSKVKGLAYKHNMMPALKYCGSNNVAHFSWSPTGEYLFFDLSHTGNLLDASKEKKTLHSLPIPRPTGDPTWINTQKIAAPVPPLEDDVEARDRIAIFDSFLHTLEYRKVDELKEIRELYPGDSPSKLYFSAKIADGSRTVFLMNVDDGSVQPAFSWLEGHVDTFTYTAEVDVVVLGLGDTVTAHKGQTGDPIGSWTPASRGVMHPTGQWLALEHEGEEVSVFYQRSWNELTDRDRKKEKQRVQQLEDSLPEWYDSRVRLPTLSMVEMESQRRWALTGMYGTKFQWYKSQHSKDVYYGTYILWGFEGKQFNRNIMLGDLFPLLRSMQLDKPRDDYREMIPPKTATEGQASEADQTIEANDGTL